MLKQLPQWVYEIASKRRDATFEIVDLKDYNLPLARRNYSGLHASL
jgi:hypothetical protein